MSKFANPADYEQTAVYLRKFQELFAGIFVPQEFLVAMVDSISLNDPAHHLGHVYDVTALTRELCRDLDLNYHDTEMAMVGALLHDIGCKYDRLDHHVIGYGLTFEYLHLYWRGGFTKQETRIIAKAVLEHRSSNEAKPTSVISEIVSVADTGKPDIDLYIKRAIQYRLSVAVPESPEAIQTFKHEVKLHLHEKFGLVDGYHWKSYPDLGSRFFKGEWDTFTAWLEPGKDVQLTALIEGKYNTLRGL